MELKLTQQKRSLRLTRVIFTARSFIPAQRLFEDSSTFQFPVARLESLQRAFGLLVYLPDRLKQTPRERGSEEQERPPFNNFRLAALSELLPHSRRIRLQ